MRLGSGQVPRLNRREQLGIELIDERVMRVGFGVMLVGDVQARIIKLVHEKVKVAGVRRPEDLELGELVVKHQRGVSNRVKVRRLVVIGVGGLFVFRQFRRLRGESIQRAIVGGSHAVEAAGGSHGMRALQNHAVLHVLHEIVGPVAL